MKAVVHMQRLFKLTKRSSWSGFFFPTTISERLFTCESDLDRPCRVMDVRTSCKQKGCPIVPHGQAFFNGFVLDEFHENYSLIFESSYIFLSRGDGQVFGRSLCDSAV